MGYPINDLIIADTIKQGIADLIAQPWLIKNMMGDIDLYPEIQKAYGQEAQNCTDFLLNNKINIYNKFTLDTVTLPAITIALGSSSEDVGYRTSADVSTMNITYAPSDINRQIKYLVAPFVPESYDPITGIFVVPTDIDLGAVNAGQVLLNPVSGEGFIIEQVLSHQVRIEAGNQINWSKIAIFPQYPVYKAHVKQDWYRQTFTVAVSTSDPSTLLWLEAIVGYILLRYKVTLLEKRNFCESTFSVSDFAPNSNFSGPEIAYSRYFSLSGITPITWVDDPSRIVEAVTFKNSSGLSSIKILSNLDSPAFLKTDTEAWETVIDEE